MFNIIKHKNLKGLKYSWVKTGALLIPPSKISLYVKKSAFSLSDIKLFAFWRCNTPLTFAYIFVLNVVTLFIYTYVNTNVNHSFYFVEHKLT